MAKLEIRDIEKNFVDKKHGNTLALHSMNLNVLEKEFLAIVGPSGCGKSTLLQLIAGLEHPSNGSILINSIHISAPIPECGIVFQEYALFPWKTVRGNVEFGPKMKGIPRIELEDIVRKYIRLAGLEGFENHFPNQLSGGMKQRVAIARTLANEPDVLLMDEPFAAVDAQLREILQQEVLDIWEKTKKTVIFVTHQIEEAVFLADRVAIMTGRPGRIKDIVDINLSRPRHREDRISPDFQRISQQIREEIWEELSGASSAHSVGFGA
jgi:NitT/TauT family transport system ATP-binding protein